MRELKLEYKDLDKYELRKNQKFEGVDTIKIQLSSFDWLIARNLIKSRREYEISSSTAYKSNSLIESFRWIFWQFFSIFRSDVNVVADIFFKKDTRWYITALNKKNAFYEVVFSRDTGEKMTVFPV